MLDKKTKTITLERAGDSFFSFRCRKSPTELTTPDRSEFKFVVKGGFERDAQVDPGDPQTLFFHFTEADAISLGSKPREYQILRTRNGLSRPYLRGMIQAAGFAA